MSVPAQAEPRRSTRALTRERDSATEQPRPLQRRVRLGRRPRAGRSLLSATLPLPGTPGSAPRSSLPQASSRPGRCTGRWPRRRLASRGGASGSELVDRRRRGRCPSGWGERGKARGEGGALGPGGRPRGCPALPRRGKSQPRVLGDGATQRTNQERSFQVSGC